MTSSPPASTKRLKARRDRRSQRRRQPPKPWHYHRAPRGTCRYCGKRIFHKGSGKINTRAHWHPECAAEWRVINDPKEARRAVFLRDLGLCANGCGYFGPEGVLTTIGQWVKNRQLSTSALGGWDVDHIVPIHAASRRDLSHWKMGNLQTLCKSCHKAKTAQENSDRQKNSCNGG